jgi:hypothetical protein
VLVVFVFVVLVFVTLGEAVSPKIPPPVTARRSDDEIEGRVDTVAIDLGITVSLLGCDEP